MGGPGIPGLRCAPTWALESRPFGAKEAIMNAVLPDFGPVRCSVVSMEGRRAAIFVERVGACDLQHQEPGALSARRPAAEGTGGLSGRDALGIECPPVSLRTVADRLHVEMD
jgi:hypothetical protein